MADEPLPPVGEEVSEERKPLSFRFIPSFKRARRAVIAHESDLAYCKRLLQEFNRLNVPDESDPKRTKLLSHVPEWAKEIPRSVHSLQGIPRLQAALANCTAYSPSKWLLEQELACRKVVDAKPSVGSSSAAQRPWSPPAEEDASSGKAEDVWDAAARMRLTGLAFSGGGIRSATFCLGVLQALAKHDLLRRFDYLSSVSGGGYIHQWLAAWIDREPEKLAAVQRKLIPVPSDHSLARSPEQIQWLRRYSSYLTPQRGLFSVDTWTMAAIWFRNTFLNQLVLFSFFAVGILLVRGLMHVFTADWRPPVAPGGWQVLLTTLTVGSIVWAVVGLVFLARALGSQTAKAEPSAGAPPGAIGDAAVVLLIVLPGFLFSLLLSLVAVQRFRMPYLGHHEYLASTSALHEIHLLLAFWTLFILGLLLAITFGGKAIETAVYNSPTRSKAMTGILFVLSAVFCTAVAMGVAFKLVSPGGYRGESISRRSEDLAYRLNGPLRHQPKDAVPGGDSTVGQTNRLPCAPCLTVSADGNAAVPATPKAPAPISVTPPHPIKPEALIALFLPLTLFGLQFLAIRLQIGLLGRSYEESRREWLARFGAWSAIVSFGWFGMGAIALLGPPLYYWFFDISIQRKIYSSAAVLLVHAVTLYAGSSSKTSGKPNPTSFFGYRPLDLIGLIGAPLAILSLLLIFSGFVDIGVNAAYVHLGQTGPFWVFVGMLAVLLLFGRRVDVNEFSLHPFYRDRLARCYLGATNGMRTPDPFTGFDDHSEASIHTGIGMGQLLPRRFGGKCYDGPFAIFCTTINLTFGEDLGYQERKGASFAFTPMYSGYHVGWTAEKGGNHETTFNGFVKTREYAYRTILKTGNVEEQVGVPLATAAAISGAALSPNQGFTSQPSLAFLMTLFNVRLSWWIANPRRPAVWPSDCGMPSPRFGLVYLLRELFGLSDDTSNYVNLCDGGRFDNMGMYELVRRRCRLIVICDGEEDDKTTFEGIGLTIAKCRTDFGVEINLDLKALTPDPLTQLSPKHFQVGSIRYPAPPGAAAVPPWTAPKEHPYMGKIVYLKTTVVGDEPGDILHYKREHPDFPQESTLNQWFTETQFESYRRLGQLIGEQACAEIYL